LVALEVVLSICFAKFYFRLTILQIYSTQCHIIRLPCQIWGNFTKQWNKYGIGDVILSTNMSMKNCVGECISNLQCHFANFNDENNLCEVVKANDVHSIGVVSKTKWCFLSTDYSNNKNFGNKCNSVNPCEPILEACYDTCEAPNYYKCIPKYINVALISTITVSSANNSPDFAKDGILNNYFRSWDGTSHWMQVDITKQENIEVIRIYGRPDFPSLISDYNLYVGNDTDNMWNNDHVALTSQSDVTFKDYMKLIGPMVGRYVILKSATTIHSSMNMAEIQIFVSAM